MGNKSKEKIQSGKLPGVPLKLLEESVGHLIVVELQQSIVVRGRLMNVDPISMNIQLENVIVKDNASTRRLTQIIIRGNLILYVIMPYMIKHSPLLQKVIEVANVRKEHFIVR